MKIQKTELAQKLNKIKSVVPKKTSQAVLQGILVKDGYLIANNMEMAVKAKIGGAEGESFIIPERAFDLINSLPDGEVEVAPTAGNSITVKAGKTKGKFQTLDAGLFPTVTAQWDGGGASIDAGALMESMGRVAYAVPANAPGKSAAMTAMCLQAAGGHLNFAGLDGHVLAWDKIGYDGEFELLIPKNTVDKMKPLGLSGEAQIRHNRTGAVFITEDFEIYTRLIEGEYFKYQTFFKGLPLHTVVSRQSLLDAMVRAKMCTEEKCPVRFEMSGNTISLSIKDKTTDYNETVELQEEMPKELTIGFDARLVLETLKAFDCDNVGLSLEEPKMPMIVEAEGSDFRAIVLPVNLG